MIYLVLGDVESGKTTILGKIIEGLERDGVSCGGVLCPAVFDGERKVGSVAVDVKTKDRVRFAFHKSTGFSDGEDICEWVISREGIDFGLQAIKRGFTCDVLFVDEVGPLEFSKRGFMSILPDVFEGERNVVVAMKRHVKERFYKFFPNVEASEFDVADGKEIAGDIAGRIMDGA